MTMERVLVSQTDSFSYGIAGRYATAVFELAKEGKDLAAVEKDLSALDAALTDSADLRELIASPVYSRDQQAAAMAASQENETWRHGL